MIIRNRKPTITLPAVFSIYELGAQYGRQVVAVDAVAEVPFHTHCSRCWKEISRLFTLNIHKVLATRQSLQNQTEDNDDYLMIEDQKIDLDSPLLEAIMLEFPYTFVCKEDCKGLCTKCGKDLNEGDCDCLKKEIDPRLAILQKLLDK